MEKNRLHGSPGEESVAVDGIESKNELGFMGLLGKVEDFSKGNVDGFLWHKL